MIRFRLLLWPLVLGITLTALMLFLFRSQSAEAEAQVWGDPHVSEWGVVADLTGSMAPELDAFRDAWSQFQPPSPEAGAYRLAAFSGEAAYIGQANSAAEFTTMLEQLETGEEGLCPTAALNGLAQLLMNSSESTLKTSQALLVTDATPRARPQQIAYMVELMLRRGIRLNTILSGWCEGSLVPKPAMAFLAEGTGGQLVRPKEPGDYISETLVSLNLMEKADTIMSRVVVLQEGQPDSIDIPLSTGGISLGVDTKDTDSSDGDDDDDWVYRCLTCLIPSPYVLPMVVPEAADLQVQLKDPEDNVIGAGTPGFAHISTVAREFLEVERDAGSPLEPGQWQLQLLGSGTYWINVKAETGLHMTYLGPSWSHGVGRPTRLLAGLVVDDPGLQPAAIQFRLTSLTGNTIVPLTLHDDGQHGDGAAEDGLYGGAYIPAIPGFWYLEVLGESEDGSLFRRVDPAPIRVQRFRVPNPPPILAMPNSTERMTFTLSNENQPPDGLVAQDLTAGTTFELEIFSSQGWAITETVPASVTVDFGASIEIGLDVNVPVSATIGATEETTLVVLEAGDIATSYNAMAQTTVLFPSVYLPYLRR